MRMMLSCVILMLTTSPVLAQGVGLMCDLERYISRTEVHGRWDLDADANLVAVTMRASDAVQIWDYADPAAPTMLSEVNTGLGNFSFVDLDGETLAAARQGQPTVVLFDASDPSSPQHRDNLVVPGNVQIFSLSGDRLYASNGFTVWVYDITDLTNPTLLGADSLALTANQFVVKGGLLFASHDTQLALQIYDVSDPASGFSELGGGDTPSPLDSYYGVSVEDDIAAISGYLEVYLFDISDPSSPSMLSTIPGLDMRTTFGNIGEVALRENRLAASWKQGVSVYDISDPGNPSLIMQIGGPDVSACPRFAVLNGAVLLGADFSYAAASPSTILVVDTEVPAENHVANSVSVTGSTLRDLETHNGLVYALDVGNDRLVIVDPASAAGSPVVGSIVIGDVLLRGIAIDGSTAFVGFGEDKNAMIAAVDVSDPAAPSLLGTWSLMPSGNPSIWSPERIGIDGSTLCVLDAYAGIVLFDVSDPVTPVQMGYRGPLPEFGYDTTGLAVDEGWMVYSADQFAGAGNVFKECGFIDLSDPSTIDIQTVFTSPFGGGLAISEGVVYYTAYISDSDFDAYTEPMMIVFDPALGTEIGRRQFRTEIDWMPAGALNDLYASDGFVYCRIPDGIGIFDVSDPADPVYLGNAQTSSFSALTGEENLLYARSGSNHIETLLLMTDCRPCLPDLNGDGVLDIFDVFAFLDAFNAGDPSADFTGDGSFDIFDVFGFLDAFNAGCP